MPVFEYKGMSRGGKNVKGIVDADNQRAAKAKLKKDGIFVTSMSNKTKSGNKKKKKSVFTNESVPIEEISNMTRQLASLVKANIPLVDCLAACSDQMENMYLKGVLAECRNQVNEGIPLHVTFAKYPKVFDNIFINMVEAGEMSGSLDNILLRLAEFTEARAELKSRVTSAMMYPVIMVVLIIGIMMGMFVFVCCLMMNVQIHSF